jgi:hypothetical protein
LRQKSWIELLLLIAPSSGIRPVAERSYSSSLQVFGFV